MMKKLGKIFFFSFITVFMMSNMEIFSEEVAVSRSEAAVMRSKMVEYSKKFIGCPYVSGGIGPNSFDCSGFVFTVSRESIKVQLPRMTRAQLSFSTQIPEKEREAGDLVFFKTTSSGNVSHVGIYIGRNQFIHCASDGPNTGVIVSSLNESYWKAHYYCTARFLPSSKSELLADSSSGTSSAEKKTTDSKKADSSSSVTSSSNSSIVKKSENSGNSEASSRGTIRTFLSNLIADGTLLCDWNFYTYNSCQMNFRGISSTANVMYNFKYVKPGIGSAIRFDAKTRNLQLPFFFSITVLDYFRAYAGPVLFIKHPRDPDDSSNLLRQSFFPGIFGTSVSTPSINIKKISLSLVQDLHYTVFKNWNDSSLSPKKALTTGLVFSTGIKVTLPVRALL